jgi:acylpyruvate hydrolase
MPGEDAPEHRHTQHAFRFVVEGEGVWTVVGGDPVAMRRGDFLPQAGWNWHAHCNASAKPMAWLDGLDIPFQYLTETQFFEPVREQLSEGERITPDRSRAERLWGHPGLRPVAAGRLRPASPLLAYRWEHTDRALADQLALEAEGFGGTVEPGHAAVRFTNPATGSDVLPTIRAEMHRIARGTETAPVLETGSSMYQVFDGSATVTVGDRTWSVTRQPFRGAILAAVLGPFRGRPERLRLRRPRPVPLQRLTYLRGAQAQPLARGRKHPLRLATIRIDGSTRAVKADGDTLIDLGASDVGELLSHEGWADRATAATAAVAAAWPAAGAAYAPLVPRPSKVVCVGLNYRTHIQEMGRDLPKYPTLFAKFADALIGARDDIVRPAETGQFDWEAELAVIIGSSARHARGAAAKRAIGGFTIVNDVTCRDWQFRTREWLQGKTWDSSTPVGPFLVTPDELPGGVRPALGVRLLVDGEVMQSDSTADLLFDPVALVEYVSTIVRLNRGDIIATGTPGGVGHARKPPRFLVAGETVVTEIEGLGRQENRVVKEPSP